MNQSEAMNIALQAADSAILLESAAQVSRAAKAWRRADTLGIDTEFVRERTYHANLGLVQISDGRSVWLLDPLAIGVLEPLAELLRDGRVGKILHSPSEDLEVLQHAVGALPEPLIDTQVACALLGQPLQMGYHSAVQWLFRIEIDKEHTRSNWCARPLRPEQLHYAALDVCLLPLMWDQLRERLAALGRLEWFEEDCQRQLAKARTPATATELWQRVRGAGRLDPVSLAVLQELVNWRETQARKFNRPRGFIVPDAVLLIIADGKMAQIADLRAVEGLHPRALQRHGEALCRIVRDTLTAGRTLQSPPALTGAQRRILKRLREQVGQTALELGVEAALLAPRRELEELVRIGPEEVPERLKGWREAQITTKLLHIVEGDS